MSQNDQLLRHKDFFKSDVVKSKFAELLGNRASGFMTSVLSIVSQSDALQLVTPESVYMCAMVAATLDLPLNSNLGFAYIVPYKDKATFQMGYKGFIQLAQRSGQFKTIAATPIYEGQIIEANPLTGYVFDFAKKTNDTVIGYAAYFSLINGFEKTMYMSVDDLNKHGKSFSQTFKKGFGLWKDNFDAMAQKTVIKLLLSKFAPLSVEMQKAIVTDQAVINDADADDVTYADNGKPEPVQIDHIENRIGLLIADCKTLDELKVLQQTNPDYDVSLFYEKEEELKTAKKSA